MTFLRKILSLVKVTIGQHGARRHGRWQFSYGKTDIFDVGTTKRLSVEEDVLGIARFTRARDTFFLTIAQTKQEGHERKSRK